MVRHLQRAFLRIQNELAIRKVLKRPFSLDIKTPNVRLSDAVKNRGTSSR